MTTLMLYNADNEIFTRTDSIWNEIINSSYNLDIHIILGLIYAYIETMFFDEVIQIIHQPVSYSKNGFMFTIIC